MNGKTKDPSAGAIAAVVGFFRSTRLTLVLLALLALISFFGTTGRDFAFSLGQVNDLHLDFRDVYHTSVYRLLLGMLFINLLVCTLDRLPAAIRKIRLDSGPVPPPPPREPDHIIKIKATDADQALNKVEMTLALGGKMARGKATVRGPAGKKKAEAKTAFRATGLLSALGPQVTHLGILLIIVGGLYGSMGSFEASLILTPGSESSKVMRKVKGQSLGERSGIAYIKPKGEGPVPQEENQMVEHELDFTIRCNDFRVTFYDESAMASDYIADLSIVDNGSEVVNQKIEVNKPLYYKGYGIYQSTYGPDPDQTRIRLVATYRGQPDAEAQEPAAPLAGQTAQEASGSTVEPTAGATSGGAAEDEGPADGSSSAAGQSEEDADTSGGQVPTGSSTTEQVEATEKPESRGAMGAGLRPGDTVACEISSMTPCPVPGHPDEFWVFADYKDSMRGHNRDMGPNIKVARFKGDEMEQSMMLFERIPDFDRQREGEYFLSFKTVGHGYYTGLQIIKDPGLYIIWVGFALLCIGVVQSFIVHHHRYWLVAVPAEKGVFEVRLMGRSKKAAAMFKSSFARQVEQARANLEDGE